MAAGKFYVYNQALRNILEGKINLASHVIKALAVHKGYTPATASHSSLLQISPYQATASGSLVPSITLSSVNITGSGATTVKFDAADLSGISAGGDTFKCKYVALYAESASRAGVDNLLLGFFDTDTLAATGIEGTQVNVVWAAGGIFKINGNQ